MLEVDFWLEPMFQVDAELDAAARAKDELVIANGCDLEIDFPFNLQPHEMRRRLLEIGAWIGMAAPAADCVWLVLDRFIFIDMDCRSRAQGGGQPDILARIQAL